jgi:hypothetical protein
VQNNSYNGEQKRQDLSPIYGEMEPDVEKKLDRLYNDPVSSASFAGVDRLWKEAKKELGNKIKKKHVEHYLEGHRTYTLLRPRRIHFKRSKTIAAGFMTDIQVDLADLQSLARHNKGNRYILVAIDVLSKRIFIVPLRSKKANDMVEAFDTIIKQMPMKPHRIFSDKGTEFKNHLLKEYFDREEVEKYEANSSSVKASLAERAIRNLKQRLYRYFAQKRTMTWLDVIQKIADGINKSPSRVHGMRPIDVNFSNAQQVWKHIFGDELSTKLKITKAKLKEGEFVRMSRNKGQFEKGYLPNYGDEILEIDVVKDQSRPIRYKVRDEKGEKFKGSFYGEELARVRKDAATEYRIEKVYRKRKRDDGTKDVLVKFIGYPEKEWIHETQLV